MDNSDKINLEKIRHSCAHLMAHAVMDLYPDVKIAIGPTINNGFYYDFEFNPNNLPSDKDFEKIEKRMEELAKEGIPYEQEWVSVDEARKIFANQPYKLEIIGEIDKGEREDLGQKGKVSIYRVGKFVDLCKGPHVASTKEIGPFKLLSIAGAYWKGRSKNKMLVRVYGTSYPTRRELDQYFVLLEKAKKRDHREIGKKLDLFFFSDLVGSGLPLWTPKGTVVREKLNEFVQKLREERGYQRVTIPHLAKKDLYETSGHWAKFFNDLFKIHTREDDLFVIKPMNCPHHTQIFAHIPRSYKDMPQRYAETTMIYRDEQTGELAGLSRVRCVTQDDAHVFCRKSQVKKEFAIIWDIVDRFYSAFGFDLKVRLSLHDPKNMKAYLGKPEAWKEAENALREIAKERKTNVFEAVGEAAFYGPKIDFIAKDSLGREWQVATIQLDINMPERFDLHCINEKGEKERIFMIHCAIMGSIERFLSILIEHYGGAFPLWISPVQTVVIPISDKHASLAEKVYHTLKEQNFRVEINKESNTVGYKIRESTLQKIPYMVIIGDKETAKSDKDIYVSVRTREGKDLGLLALSDLIESLNDQLEKRV
jgi:threonyl-tRNA synthetase